MSGVQLTLGPPLDEPPLLLPPLEEDEDEDEDDEPAPHALVACWIAAVQSPHAAHAYVLPACVYSAFAHVPSAAVVWHNESSPPEAQGPAVHVRWPSVACEPSGGVVGELSPAEPELPVVSAQPKSRARRPTREVIRIVACSTGALPPTFPVVSYAAPRREVREPPAHPGRALA